MITRHPILTAHQGGSELGLLDAAIKGRKCYSIHAGVVSELGRSIIAGKLPEGSMLPGDSELLAHFGVSRTVLREAMKTLSAKRLVEAKARVGTRVLESSRWNFFDADVLRWRFETGFDELFVEHLSEMRLALEPAAAAAAATRASDAEILQLFALAAKFDNPDHTAESIVKVDLEFHLAIAAMSGNPFMRSMSSAIEAALAISFTLSSPAASPTDIADCAADHLGIARAIAQRDPEVARNTMQNVIMTGVERIRSTYMKAASPLPNPFTEPQG